MDHSSEIALSPPFKLEVRTMEPTCVQPTNFRIKVLPAVWCWACWVALRSWMSPDTLSSFLRALGCSALVFCKWVLVHNGTTSTATVKIPSGFTLFLFMRLCVLPLIYQRESD